MREDAGSPHSPYAGATEQPDITISTTTDQADDSEIMVAYSVPVTKDNVVAVNLSNNTSVVVTEQVKTQETTEQHNVPSSELLSAEQAPSESSKVTLKRRPSTLSRKGSVRRPAKNP
jgi:hypothetical protein